MGDVTEPTAGMLTSCVTLLRRWVRRAAEGVRGAR